jgi:starvation-inducible DNA-binding protein
MATRTRASKAKSPVIETMNGRLADLIDLHWQIKQAHWNVTGPNFIAVHELFDEQATLVRQMADTVAERARALQEPAEGTIRRAVSRTTIDEFPAGLIAWDAAIAALLERYEQQSAQYKDAAEEADEAGDPATNDMYVELIRTIDQAAYFLRAHLK